jgi:hypothetical protein
MINIELNKHDVDKKGQEGGLALESEVVALWRLTSISRWSKAKFK